MAPRRYRALNAAALIFTLLLSIQGFAVPPRKIPHKKKLAELIQAVLSQPQLEQAYWGIEARDLATGKTLYSLNSARLFLPASNAKLFTTAGALSLARPDYRFVTTVEAEGKIDVNGRLLGNLVIVGRGDPNLSGRVLPYALKTERQQPHTQILEEMADQVAAAGLKIVDGDILGDDTFYSPQRYGEGWAQDDLQWIDGAPVSALTFNDNVVFVNIQPGEHEGDKALVTLEPETSYYEIENRVLTSGAGITRKIGVQREIGSRKVMIWGSLPPGDPGIKEALAVEDPAEFTAQIFRSLLERRGIMITGKAKARHGESDQFFEPAPSAEKHDPHCCDPGGPGAGMAPPAVAAVVAPAVVAPAVVAPAVVAPAVLARHVSLPFIEDVRVTNKTSQNLHAELALRLAGKLGGQGGSFEGGRAALKQFLTEAGLKGEDFVLLDGSGLSRRDLVTPAAVVQLLTYVAHQPWGRDYESTLPIAGVDGSLSERFLKSPAAGLVHAKTGTLSHVNALSGYGQTLRGERFVFSIFCNNHNLPSTKVLAAIDSIVQALITAASAK